MKKSILEIYALAVCFVTVICFVVCLGISGYSLIQIEKPDFTMKSYEYNRYQSNDAYWKYASRNYDYSKENNKLRSADELLTKQRTEGFKQALASERRDGFQTLIKTMIIILINIFAFMLHWLIARKARNNATASQETLSQVVEY